MNDELERAAIAEPHRREVSNVSSRKATDAKIFREHDDRRLQLRPNPSSKTPNGAVGYSVLVCRHRRTEATSRGRLLRGNDGLSPWMTTTRRSVCAWATTIRSSAPRIDSFSKDIDPSWDARLPLFALEIRRMFTNEEPTVVLRHGEALAHIATEEQ